MVELIYTGSGDLTMWLSKNSLAEPELIPRRVEKDHVLVGLEYSGDKPKLYLLDQPDLSACSDTRIWFILPRTTVARETAVIEAIPHTP